MSDSLAPSTRLSKPRTARGRPVGTGIDDAERLARIRAHMSAHAGMKPTTAIKAIGISDPSAIRRLRDKLKVPAYPANSAERLNPAYAQRAVACPTARNDNAFKISEPPSGSQSFARARPSFAIQDESVVACLGAFIRAMTAAFQAQRAIAELMVANPVVKMTLTNCIAANELAASLIPVPASPRRTI